MDQMCVSKYSLEPSMTFTDDDMEFMEFCDLIMDELVEDTIWDVCFEVHRIAQHGIILDFTEQEQQNLVVIGTDSSGQKAKSQTPNIICSSCGKKTGAYKYTTHLAKCLGFGGRTSSRAAANKIADAFDDSEEGEEDTERVKKSQKKPGKKTKPSKGQSNPKPALTLEDLNKMSFEQREEYFREHCGAISKKTKKMCKNSLKCTFHKDEARRSVRLLLGCGGDQTTNDEQIDVDTVDEGMWQGQWP